MSAALAVAGVALALALVALGVIVAQARRLGRASAEAAQRREDDARQKQADAIRQETVADEAAWLEHQQELVAKAERARALATGAQRLRDYRDAEARRRAPPVE